MLQPALDRSKLNDEWITENSVSDPENLPEIPGYHILVRPMVIKVIMYVMLNIQARSFYIKGFGIY